MRVCDICKKEDVRYESRIYGLPRLELCEECYNLLTSKASEHMMLAYNETCEERGAGKKAGLRDQLKMLYWKALQ